MVRWVESTYEQTEGLSSGLVIELLEKLIAPIVNLNAMIHFLLYQRNVLKSNDVKLSPFAQQKVRLG